MCGMRGLGGMSGRSVPIGRCRLDLGDELSEQLIGAVERAAVAERVTAELSTARAELAAAERRVTRLTELAAAEEGGLRSLEQRSWLRLVRFARGSLDEDLRVERAEAEAARARLVQTSGALEDTQIRVSLLAAHRAEFVDAPYQLAQALDAMETWVHHHADWRSGQLHGLTRRRAALTNGIEQLQTVDATLARAVEDLQLLRAATDRARLAGALPGPNALMLAVTEHLEASRAMINRMWSQLEAAPIRLPDVRPAPSLPKVDLATPEVVLGYSTGPLTLADIRRATDAQLDRLRELDTRLEAEIERRKAQVADVAAIRQRLLMLRNPPGTSGSEVSADG